MALVWLDGGPPPEWQGPEGSPSLNVAVLDSSFNPPTLAHAALVEWTVRDRPMHVLLLFAVHNLDKSNYQYLLRGLLVHLDDPSPEIQQAMFAVLEVALNLDPPVFAAEVVAVRERHRSTKLCDRLIEQARAHGQLV